MLNPQVGAQVLNRENIIPKLIEFTLIEKFLKFVVGMHDKSLGIPWRFVSRDTLASF